MAEFKTLPSIDKWETEHIKKCKTPAFDGAQFEYSFVPTGIVEVQTIKCMICKKAHTVYND